MEYNVYMWLMRMITIHQLDYLLAIDCSYELSTSNISDMITHRCEWIRSIHDTNNTMLITKDLRNVSS